MTYSDINKNIINFQIYKKQGWHRAEKSGTWTSQQDATLVIKQPLKKLANLQEDLKLLISGLPFLAEKQPENSVRILCNNETIAELKFIFGDVLRDIEVIIPKHLVVNNELLEIVFSCQYLNSPKSLGISTDPRKLGFFIHEIKIASDLHKSDKIKKFSSVYVKEYSVADNVKSINNQISNNTEQNDLIGQHWSNVTKKNQEKNLRTRWWQSPTIIRYINKKVFGLPLDGFSNGLTYRAKEIAKDQIPFSKGISVGCGNGAKEMSLIRQGLVQHFTLYELSEYRVEKGQELAKNFGLEDKVNFVIGDAFQIIDESDCFDFVHWNNSLHHMLDVENAVKWSHKVLIKGGMFYMDDYVGKNYLQFNERTSMLASQIRQVLPEKYLINPNNPEVLLPKDVKPPDKLALIATDPSEAPDSENIIPCVRKYFPDAEITLTGGAIYNTTINDVIANMDETSDKLVLELLMIVDELLSELGENQYATALAIK